MHVFPQSSNKASVLLALVFLPILGCGAKGTPVVQAEAEPAFVSPYRNTSSDVRYAGSESCAACHPTHVEQFRSHPMGRSMMRWAEARPVERYDAEAHNPFTRFDREFLVQQENGHTNHSLIRRDRNQKEIYTLRQEVEFVIGSGTHGRAYLSQRDNYLFQTPINWFSQTGRWDLAPNVDDQNHFELVLPIEANCLFCHANKAEPDESVSGRRYLAPLPAHPAIGCERCHGPGSLHVERRTSNEAVEEIDDTIVNPARLELHLRDAVCEQCHLQGQARILRTGRKVFDFRPGLPLQSFWSIFMVEDGGAGGTKAVSHVEQMQASRCYQASAGKLGCISCHDPHMLPRPKEADAFFRGRCLTCHNEKSCTLGMAERSARNGDSCHACHMQQVATTDIAHQAITDHRVPRRPDNALGMLAKHGREILPRVPLTHFHADVPPFDEQGLRRDLALAIVQRIEKMAPADPNRRLFASVVLPSLEAAAMTAPDDVAALQGLGLALGTLDRKGEAMTAFERALAVQPNRESVLFYAASLASSLGRQEAAFQYCQRALKLNPWTAGSHYYSAISLWQLGRKTEAIAECRAAIGINPENDYMRKMLITFLIDSGDQTGAKREFAELMRLEPPDREELERAFGKLVH
jgi:hypothetical protein